jgi:hypothetical protein
MANRTTNSTAVLVGRSSVACMNECGMVVLLSAVYMGHGPQEAWEAPRETSATRMGGSEIAPRGD